MLASQSLNMSFPNHNEITIRCFFEEPRASGVLLLQAAVDLLGQHHLEPEHFTIEPGHGSRRSRRPPVKKYSKSQIVEEVRLDRFEEEIGEGFIVQAQYEEKQLQIHLSPAYARSPFQDFGITGHLSSRSPFASALILETSHYGSIALAGLYNGDYASWQRCNRLNGYLRKYGPNPGFAEIRAENAHQSSILLDVSKNPGRLTSVNKMPAWVCADMWLGPRFWKYAPCTKEQVLKEPWIKVEDAVHYLYLKAHPDPFTMPNGEQGRIQRRLWNLLFHQDCEWPPRSGGVA